MNITIESNTDVYNFTITTTSTDTEAEFMSKAMTYTMYKIGKCSLSKENSLCKFYEDVYLPALTSRLAEKFLFKGPFTLAIS